MSERVLLSMFYKPDRSGSTTVTFSKYMKTPLGQAAI